jgi:DNA invertase Pin-like site-specific DNA recombinase
MSKKPPYSSARSWIDRRGRVWTISIDWSDTTPQAEPSRLTVVAPDGNGVTGDAIRKMPLGSIIAEARAGFESFLRHDAQSKALTPAQRRHAAAQAKRFSSHRGVARTDDELAIVADVYREGSKATDEQPFPKPAQAVAKHFDISVSTANKRIAAARERGLLEPAKKRVGR